MKIGVLALQGAVAEHVRMLQKAGAEAFPIKKVEQLEDISGLVIPGGESTTIGRLMRMYGFMERLQQLASSGFPLFGTCAGLIILAKRIAEQETSHLGVMDIDVQRNAFGRQRESFETNLVLEGIADDFRAVFIRAPLILEVGSDVQILAKHKDSIVAARQGHYLAASFHPELTEDERLHAYFVQMVQSYAWGNTEGKKQEIQREQEI
ncbi:pyridoxal 5'-phosphate synthase glutaminase subunit PdxT [Bacillus horti]|uniref:Pyridoxal 5'-phosphate synthase subunit PdxT n=1 Tax=Caldalkalibacillus horti TaxID=77523 RepID=A0ABT9W2R9_9BACI|nr:pyridoxal 5'-phosphate synthase glutaminase subunit PdxT [Bacillus horti]MDQ0167538.1 5'-phosphate synthase pdxT subunit [Bacillus horti]